MNIPRGLALSIRQPWAWAIAAGHKDVENRSWNTHYRGPLLIHASLRIDWEGIEIVRGKRVRLPEELDVGAIIGRVQLVDVVTDSRSRWATPGLYHFLLRDPVLYRTPIPCMGQLGIFEPDRGRNSGR